MTNEKERDGQRQDPRTERTSAQPSDPANSAGAREEPGEAGDAGAAGTGHERGSTSEAGGGADARGDTSRFADDRETANTSGAGGGETPTEETTDDAATKETAAEQGPSDPPGASDSQLSGDSQGAGKRRRTRGNLRQQNPETATRREPTLGEKRARKAAEDRKQAEEDARLEAAVRRSRNRRRALVTGGATAGVAALVAAFYVAASPEEYTATCTAQNPQTGEYVAAPDHLCTQQGAQANQGHAGANGMFFMPFFLPGPGGLQGAPTQYQYSYSPAGGAAASPGQTVRQPNFTKPDGNANVKTKTGSTVQRGGFGLSGKGGIGS